MTDWKQLDERYIMPTYAHLKLPIAIAHGEGNYLYDTNGKAYLDLFTGLAVNVLGHSHPRLVETLKEQGEHFLHISNVYLSPPAITLAKRLSELTTKGKVFFTNSGAEATEAAIKLIHKYKMSAAPERTGIVVFKGGFHGRTLGALKLTRQPGVYQDFPLADFDVIEIEPGDSAALERALEQQPLAFLAEPILGSGGVYPLSEAYLKTAETLCRQHNVLLCIDEIQTGMGRTGELFAYQHAGIDPDLILFAKGIGGGLPLGGLIAKPEWSNLFGPGDHGTTFAPSPLSAALGNTVLDVLLEEGLLNAANQTMDYFWDKLRALKKEIPALKDIRGKGFMVGVATDGTPEQIKALRLNMLNDGFLIDVTQKTIVRLLPPLTLKIAEVDAFISAFTRHLKTAFSGEN